MGKDIKIYKKKKEIATQNLLHLVSKTDDFSISIKLWFVHFPLEFYLMQLFSQCRRQLVCWSI